jgi:2,4-dienoyl-CoA reductase-like NADH-dependent reductase (Old Yellow Enzyme family)
MPTLFDPIHLGAVHAPNRIVMAPLTRGRSTREHVPTELMAQYYSQRASAGLILSEATGISQEGLGWPNAPGIWNEEQTDRWSEIVKHVHGAGGRIACQLWHMGRLVHPSFLGGHKPVSSSATTGPGEAHTNDGRQRYEAARPLELEEIPRLLEDYRRAAANALKAGFDGVQIHAANGYLIDQFLRNNANFRADAYGGSVENRVRLLREVAEAVVGVAGRDRTGVRLSPNGDSQGVNDSDPEPLFQAAGAALAEVGIAYLELREPGPNGTFGKGERPALAPAIKAAFKGPLILNSDYDRASAAAALASGPADAISFGRPFISNPDLPHRLQAHIPLAKDDPKTWYVPGAEGYTTYPAAA